MYPKEKKKRENFNDPSILSNEYVPILFFPSLFIFFLFFSADQAIFSDSIGELFHRPL